MKDFEPRFLIRVVVGATLFVLTIVATLEAGIGFGNNRSVGGIVVDGAGVVAAASNQDQAELANLVRQGLEPLEGDLRDATELRMISLRGLQRAIVESHRKGVGVPDEVEYLAGLQRIEYVFADPSTQDIVIAGPAEPWTLRPDGFVVGEVTGQSTMRLADLIVALRLAMSPGAAENVAGDEAEQGAHQDDGVTCSIEATPEGRRRLRQFMRRVKLGTGQSPRILEESIKEAFGPQVIELTGVPADSRFARTMVAADFAMKRVAMGLVDSRVRGLPSYLQMSQSSGRDAGQNPRWWMACDYTSLTKSEDGLTWKLSGQGVKTLTEQDVVLADGSIKRAGRSDKLAQRWAEAMTENYSELSQQMPVFSDLRNLMDMTVVATLISREQLDRRVKLDLTEMLNPEAVEMATYEMPRSIDPQCSFIRGRGGYVVTASGGVDINAMDVLRKQSSDGEIEKQRSSLVASSSNQWWWN